MEKIFFTSIALFFISLPFGGPLTPPDGPSTWKSTVHIKHNLENSTGLLLVSYPNSLFWNCRNILGKM